LGLHPRIVILDEPTKGIDVGAKQAVYELIAEMVAQGLSVILVSSELPEVMNLAHRVIVMKRGRIVAEFGRHQADAEAIVAAASGLCTTAAEPASHVASNLRGQAAVPLGRPGGDAVKMKIGTSVQEYAV
jgi:rhamnose transport system ATP-binding protein